MMSLFGVLVFVLCTLLIVVPYIRGRSELLTAWNLILISIGIFIGVGCLEVASDNFHWIELRWFRPSREQESLYIVLASTFLALLFLFYYFFKFPQRIFAKRLQSWPPLSLGLVLFIVGFCVAVALAYVIQLRSPIPVLNALLLNISQKSVLFATVFSFVWWYRNRLSMPMLALFIGVYLFSAMFAMYAFVGRRLLLSVVLSPAFCMYWMRWRHLPRGRNVMFLGATLVVTLMVASFYSNFRHYNTKGAERTVGGLVDQMKQLTVETALNPLRQDTLHFAAQYSVWNSLLMMELMEREVVEEHTLESLQFIASYPVPRVVWPGKPDVIGSKIVQILGLPYATNWGIGIVGHCWYDGVIWALPIYALWTVLLVRLFDEPLQRQPENPFLLAALCAAFPHFTAYMRGDIGIMSVEILEAFFFAFALGIVCRLVFGTARQQPLVPVMPFRRRYVTG